MNARVQDFDAAETDYRTTSGQLTPLLTDSGIALTDDSGNPIMVMVGTITDPITGIPIPSTTLRTTEDCQNRVIEPYGAPVGLTQAAVMPYNGATQQAFGVPLSILSVISNGTATVQVTCSKVHGLQQNNQVSVQGLKNPNADGFFSVAVLGATSFTYMCYGSIPADSLLEPTTRIVTALVGIPRGFATIPQVTGPALTGAAAPTPEDLVELESDEGWIQLEDGTGSIELEDGP